MDSPALERISLLEKDHSNSCFDFTIQIESSASHPLLFNWVALMVHGVAWEHARISDPKPVIAPVIQENPKPTISGEVRVIPPGDHTPTIPEITTPSANTTPETWAILGAQSSTWTTREITTLATDSNSGTASTKTDIIPEKASDTSWTTLPHNPQTPSSSTNGGNDATPPSLISANPASASGTSQASIMPTSTPVFVSSPIDTLQITPVDTTTASYSTGNTGTP